MLSLYIVAESRVQSNRLVDQRDDSATRLARTQTLQSCVLYQLCWQVAPSILALVRPRLGALVDNIISATWLDLGVGVLHEPRATSSRHCCHSPSRGERRVFGVAAGERPTGGSTATRKRWGTWLVVDRFTGAAVRLREGAALKRELKGRVWRRRVYNGHLQPRRAVDGRLEMGV